MDSNNQVKPAKLSWSFKENEYEMELRSTYTNSVKWL